MAKNAAVRSMTSAARRSSISESSGTSGTNDAPDQISQLRSLIARGKTPAYIKQMIELMIQTRQEMKEVATRNAELLEELRLPREKNLSLKAKLASFEASRVTVADLASEPKPNDVIPKVDFEIDRSIVISHVSESSSSKPPERSTHDFRYVVELLNHLEVECTPISVYRMGRLEQGRPRLIKVVLPASRLQRLAIRRAPRLRFSPVHKGVYLRPSLSWEERMRRREQRRISGGLGNASSIQPTLVRGGSRSPVSTADPVASGLTSTPRNSDPAGNY